VGWLKNASQTLEYGKNYEGYWTGEMFVKQVCLKHSHYLSSNLTCSMVQLTEKVIPTFEEIHGPAYQAQIMVDNSQGHLAYAEDALLASWMNVNPGGAQACPRNGWYLKDGQQICQTMVFPANHPNYPNQPKGLWFVLEEHGLAIHRIRGKCKTKCDLEAIACCCRWILECQPDLQEQKSLVQEVIEKAGHICIVFPKFHCELNFIEFFWGAVKRHLWERCDMSFNTLKENMPHALSSVRLQTMEHWMHRWMDAYHEGLGTRDANAKVKAFSSTKYRSHRQIPETLASSFDDL